MASQDLVVGFSPGPMSLAISGPMRVATDNFVRLPHEIGSNKRSGFLATMHLWSERRLPWDDRPSASWVDLEGLWNSPAGHAQLHFRGFLPAVRRVADVISFFRT